MSLSNRLWDEAKEQATQCLEHPFVRGLADGSLPRECYRVFIAQDAFYLRSFGRAYDYAASIAPDDAGAKTLRRLREGVDNELRLHRSAAEALAIDLERVEALASTLAYTSFLDECVEGRSLGATLASMTPCMRLYAFLGQRLGAGPVAEPYRDWVETYATDDIEQLARTVEGLLDTYAAPAADEERSRYHRAMELEYHFFDGAWRGGRRGER